jgi:hypothetical protein
LKKAIIAAGIIIIIIGIAILGILNDQFEKTEKLDEKTEITNVIEIIDTTKKSGPFQIGKDQYKLGEYVFLHVEGLETDDKGQIIFLRGVSGTQYAIYTIIPFDGKLKSSFNQIVDIELTQELHVCNVEEVIGDWRIWFKGTEYQSLDFKFTNEILEGFEEKFSKPVC